MLASVKGTGLFEKTVTWSIESAQELSADTAIDATSGILHVAKNETVGATITVKATAKDGKTGTSTITVTA